MQHMGHPKSASSLSLSLSLHAVVDRIRVPIAKTETMSNWTVPQLRDDQEQYAAMDAIVLHYLNIGTALNWSYSKF